MLKADDLSCQVVNFSVIDINWKIDNLTAEIMLHLSK